MKCQSREAFASGERVRPRISSGADPIPAQPCPAESCLVQRSSPGSAPPQEGFLTLIPLAPSLPGRRQLPGLPTHWCPLFSGPGQPPTSGGPQRLPEASLWPPTPRLQPCCWASSRALPGWAPHQPPYPCQAESGRVPEMQRVGTGARLQGVACRTPAGPARPGRDGVGGQQVSASASDRHRPASFLFLLPLCQGKWL